MSSKPQSETAPSCPRTDRKCPWGPYFNEPHWVEWNRKALAEAGITAENPRGVCGAKVSPEEIDTIPCAFLLKQEG